MHIIEEVPPRNTRGKSVTMSKGIAYQSHIIIVGNDADDIDEEEFQVWVEEMENDVDSDTDERRSVLAESTGGESRRKPNDSTPVFEKRTDLRRHLLDSSHGILDNGVDDTASLRSQERKTSDLVLNDQQQSTGGYVNTKITPIKLAQLPSNVDIPNQSAILQTGEKKNSLKRLFSLGKKPKAELPLRRSATISIRDDDLETNWSTSVSSSIDELQQDDTSITSSRQTSLASENSTQVTVLRVFAGNVNLGTNYKTVVVDSNTNAEDLIKRAVSRFHIQQIEGNNVDSPNSRVEYYLSVKTMDGGISHE
jgi:Ras association (RalGDS/AF-6) domain